MQFIQNSRTTPLEIRYIKKIFKNEQWNVHILLKRLEKWKMKNEKMKCTNIIEKAFDPNSVPADSKKKSVLSASEYQTEGTSEGIS